MFYIPPDSTPQPGFSLAQELALGLGFTGFALACLVGRAMKLLNARTKLTIEVMVGILTFFLVGIAFFPLSLAAASVVLIFAVGAFLYILKQSTGKGSSHDGAPKRKS